MIRTFNLSLQRRIENWFPVFGFSNICSSLVFFKGVRPKERFIKAIASHSKYFSGSTPVERNSTF